jgi:hypothetical protein
MVRCKSCKVVLDIHPLREEEVPLFGMQNGFIR